MLRPRTITTENARRRKAATRVTLRGVLRRRFIATIVASRDLHLVWARTRPSAIVPFEPVGLRWRSCHTGGNSM
jgi:hypothetical protein